ncbi:MULTISPECIES: fructose-specific PTS transporter subunit EIIC [Acinetobacter]|uniref:protein-N(pi)-phosphohistidine--D-fructose phosphotransferase n=1 Tax=Acinetobacter soli TaxID=487316 RepID=A0AB38YUF4_9GAMM|nr:MULTISPECIES: fructose-specific PTS transporter subunit EIIC [Acinetobacter]KQD03197.1 PTS fructose transporter subunit IIBC [Acinetobacter soli]MCL9675887.1 fructose-specific PTS transporter subunit EIIC [Acinetobacter sp. ACZLY 512]MDQ8942604.1 fructose-specific PTS transporter subunit EIIC [Acinetobacter soli]MEB4800259.1 fructose-specific PTS transporter subunit EIIC [Acinetobacter soli]WEH92714.1 fructose-specific PTS transporter subunit EIIC [Acinetobacter soli]
MQTVQSLLFVINSTQQYVNASILAKKLTQSANKLGYTSTTIASKDDIPQHNVDVVVFLGDLPSNVAAYPANLVAQIRLDDATKNTDELLSHALNNAQAASESASLTASTGNQAKRFVAITACPTGVAHTFMAAEALQQGATKHDYIIDVETQGSVGAKNILTAEAIEAADIVILATDIEVNTDRFVGKRVYRCSTGFALKQTDKAFQQAISEAKVLESSKQAATAASGSATKEKAGVYKHLLTGVSFMLPMVVAGGLLIALSLCFGLNAAEQSGSLAYVLKQIGVTAFTLMVPMLSGYIAYSIADRPGLTPGLIGGLLATQLQAGFLGGIVSGFLAGYIALFLAKKIKLPTSLESLKPILIVPLLGTLSVGLIMYYVVGSPVAQIFEMMKDFLNNMGTTNAVLMGIVLASMMCIDLGGPINKAAYAFTVGLLTTNTYMPMAATMAGGMVPALGMALATFFAKNKFNTGERDAGKAAFVLGLCFISEGAIPFAAKDPMRVIPTCIAGGAVTGALVALFHCELVTPHGGVFVLLIPNAINHAWLYLIAIAAGSLVTGLSYALLKRREAAPLVAQKA